jgi:hypothetical protein
MSESTCTMAAHRGSRGQAKGRGSMDATANTVAMHTTTRRACANRSCTRSFGPVAWAVVLATVLALIGVLPTIGSGAPSGTTTASIRVRTSDTLWSIAESHPVTGRSTATVVDDIARLNGLRTAAVCPGTILRVPATIAPDAAFAQLETPAR